MTYDVSWLIMTFYDVSWLFMTCHDNSWSFMTIVNKNSYFCFYLQLLQDLKKPFPPLPYHQQRQQCVHGQSWCFVIPSIKYSGASVTTDPSSSSLLSEPVYEVGKRPYFRHSSVISDTVLFEAISLIIHH